MMKFFRNLAEFIGFFILVIVGGIGVWMLAALMM